MALLRLRNAFPVMAVGSPTCRPRPKRRALPTSVARAERAPREPARIARVSRMTRLIIGPILVDLGPFAENLVRRTPWCDSRRRVEYWQWQPRWRARPGPAGAAM